MPSLPSQYAVLLGWASELPVMVKMRTLPKNQCPKSDDPDFWDVWIGTENRKIDWSVIANEWQNKSKHSKKCTFYTLRFGCSFAAVNTIKPQLL